MLSRYLAICLLSNDVLIWITRLAQATVGQVNISVSKSRMLPIPLPPIAEQHRIVAKVDELMALCDQLQAAQTEREQSRDRLVAASLHSLNPSTDD
jgi:type I restriction enzyme S subunit